MCIVLVPLGGFGIDGTPEETELLASLITVVSSTVHCQRMEQSIDRQ